MSGAAQPEPLPIPHVARHAPAINFPEKGVRLIATLLAARRRMTQPPPMFRTMSGFDSHTESYHKTLDSRMKNDKVGAYTADRPLPRQAPAVREDVRRERQNLLVNATKGVGYAALGQAAHLAGTDVASNKSRSSRQNLGAALLSASLFLAACATTTPEPKVVTKVVQVPVVRACVPATFPQSPSFPDTDSAMRAAPGAGDLLQLLAAGRILRIERLKDLEAVVSACR